MVVNFAQALTAVRADNTAVKTTPGWVHWVIADAAATGGIWALESNGVEILHGWQAPSSTTFLGPFDPPVEFTADITPDNDGTNVTLTVGYS